MRCLRLCFSASVLLLALLNLPYVWLGISRDGDRYALEFFDQTTGRSIREALAAPRVWLWAHCNFDVDVADFSCSTNGTGFRSIGPKIPLPFQLVTFQGVRYSLFNYNSGGSAGGYADFNWFAVEEPRPRGLTIPIPAGKWITFSRLSNGHSLAVVDGQVYSVDGAGKAAAFQVVDRGHGRIALRTDKGLYISVSKTGKPGEVTLKSGGPGDSETFQWVDLQRGDTLLLSLATHRYVLSPIDPGPVSADHPRARAGSQRRILLQLERGPEMKFAMAAAGRAESTVFDFAPLVRKNIENT